MSRSAWVVVAVLLALPVEAVSQPGSTSSFFLPVESDSVRVTHHPAASSTPSGPTILLLPGWPAVSEDVLGLGRRLSARGSHVYVLNPRGHGRSSGTATFAGAVEDVHALLAWLRAGSRPARPGHDPDPILAGHSWGGGIALAYAARHPEVRRVISIAGSDHGAFIRRFDDDPEYGAFYRRVLESTRAPEGPVAFDLEGSLDELRASGAEHDLVTIAPRLADRRLLLIAGWDDEQVEIEHQVIPFYRALRAAGSRSVRVVAFQADHGFRTVRDELADAIHGWIGRR